MESDRLALEQLLCAVFDELQEGAREHESPAEYDRRKQEFAFHMMDWRNDLEKIADLCAHPEAWSARDAARFLVGFLSHVVPHLTNAKSLLLDEIPGSVNLLEQAASSKLPAVR